MFPVMSTEKLEASVKTRVTPSMKAELESIAAHRHLDVADIVREAVREYVAKPGVLSPVEQPQTERAAA